MEINQIETEVGINNVDVDKLKYINTEILTIRSFISNLRLLGFEDETSKLAEQAKRDPLELDENLFSKSNTPAMEIIVHFLCNMLEPGCVKDFNPYLLKGDNQRMFRDIVQNIIKSYEEKKDENGNTYLPYGSSRRTIITSAFGSRVIRFLFNLTNLVMRKQIEKYNPKSNISLYKPFSSSSSSQLQLPENMKNKMIIRSLKVKAFQESHKCKILISKIIQLRNHYKNYSNELTNQFRELLKKQEQLDKIFKEYLDAINRNDENNNIFSEEAIENSKRQYNNIINNWKIIENDINQNFYTECDRVINKIFPLTENNMKLGLDANMIISKLNDNKIIIDNNNNNNNLNMKINLNDLISQYNIYLHHLKEELLNENNELKQPIAPIVNNNFPYLQSSLHELNITLDKLSERINQTKLEISKSITQLYPGNYNNSNNSAGLFTSPLNNNNNNNLELFPPTPLTHIIPDYSSFESTPISLSNNSISYTTTPFKTNNENEIMNSVINKAKSKNMINKNSNNNNNKQLFTPSSLLKKAHQQNIKSIQKQQQQQQQLQQNKLTSRKSDIIIPEDNNNISKIPPRKYYNSKTRSANVVKLSVFSPSPPKKYQRRASPITIDITNNNNIPLRESYKLNLDNEMFSRMEEEDENKNEMNENIYDKNRIISEIINDNNLNHFSEDDSPNSISTPIPSPPVIARVPLDADDLPSPLYMSCNSNSNNNNNNSDIEEYRDVLKRMVQELTEEKIFDAAQAELLYEKIAKFSTKEEGQLLNEDILNYIQ